MSLGEKGAVSVFARVLLGADRFFMGQLFTFQEIIIQEALQKITTRAQVVDRPEH